MNVSEFSKRVGISPHTIRYYDKIGLLDNVHRSPNGHRFFSDKDVVWIMFVQRLKDTGMPIEKILEYASLRKEGASTLLARQQMLSEHSEVLKNKIATEQQHLNKLHEKIELYQKAIEGKIKLD